MQLKDLNWRQYLWEKISIKFSKVILSLIVVLALFWGGSSLFTVKKIDVESASPCVTNNQLKTSAGILGQNLILLDKEKLENSLKDKFICIKNVTLEQKLPDKVILKIASRSAVATLIALKKEEATQSADLESLATPSAEVSSDLFLVDDEGVIFAKGTTEFTPKIYAPDLSFSLGKIDNKLLINALIIINKIRSLGIEAKQALISQGSFILFPGPGPKIIFRLNDKIDVQLASLQLILAEAKINRRTIPSNDGIDSSRLKFIDLRFDKPVVRFAPKESHGER